LPAASASPVAAQKVGVVASKKTVTFDSTPKRNTYHDVTPYANVYGLHPRFFHFDRKGQMAPTDEAIIAALEETIELE